ncbi:hypothetical protein IEQ34_003122 [Dendrobium chrysotoxum]|uniref:Uncharacterized protein n=1 Tax=Dendrobium chrysotoxum TaxID=161865 RepID=A0AAV7H2S5_DENCH|nr:hypothetical protein IEQ34_003122 [Dendrobium chrysotoxum]
MYYTQESATKLFKILKNNEIYLVLQDVTNEEAEGLGADLNAIQNLESCPHLHPNKFASPKSKKIHTSPPPSPHSPHVEPPQSSPQPPIQPSSLPPTRPPTEQIHEDKAGVFPSDITTWKLQTVRGIRT